MVERHYWIGTLGPFLYDDAQPHPAAGGLLPAGTLQAALLIEVGPNPADPGHVGHAVRLDQITGAGGATLIQAFDDHSDTDIGAPADGDLIQWDLAGGEWVNVPVAGIVGSIDHGGLLGLGDDDHTQYLLASGARGLSGNWDTGAFNILTQSIRARSGESLAIYDDSGTYGLYINNAAGSEFVGADVTIQAGNHLETEEVRAVDGDGLYLREDSGTYGLLISDTGTLAITLASSATAFAINTNVLWVDTANVWVGINKSNPSTNLEIAATGTHPLLITRSDHVYANIQATAATKVAGIRFLTNSYDWYIRNQDTLAGATSGSLVFYGGSGYRAVLTPAGRLGVGQTAPDSWCEIETTTTCAVPGLKVDQNDADQIAAHLEFATSGATGAFVYYTGTANATDPPGGNIWTGTENYMAYSCYVKVGVSSVGNDLWMKVYEYVGP